MVKNQIENCKYDEDYCCECINWTDLNESNCKCHDPNPDGVRIISGKINVNNHHKLISDYRLQQ